MAKRDHQPGKLAPVVLRKLADGWHADGGNLYLFVRGTGRTWVFRYTAPDGLRRNMGLGSLDSIPLARARAEAAKLRAEVRDPLSPSDPQERRKQERAGARLDQARRMTFQRCAEAYIDSQKHGWKNPKHTAQWESTLATYVYPLIGDLPIAEVDTALVIKCLDPIWTTRNETARRIRGRVESILDWARTSGFRTGENPARWKGHLENILAAPSKVQVVKHHAALPIGEVGTFMQLLRQREGVGARALEFAILTAARSGEVRGATWSEIDLSGLVWTIPAERMKAGKEHRVPLSPRAVEILKGMGKVTGSEFVFPGAKPDRPMSDMTLTSVLRRMDRGDLTAHGFRSTFRDWAGETTNSSREVIEHALAHQLKDKAEAAYARGSLFQKRRRLMDNWATYCATVRGESANVVEIRGAA
jgi:integrase